ncbi:MAG: tetratricopeptide repeat protein [Deferrisomatales bacterium]
MVGLKAYQDGFHDLAVKELRAFLAARPTDPRRADVLYVLAQAELARGDGQGARQALGELAGLASPRAVEAQYWLGWLAIQEGNQAEALARMDRYLAAGGGERTREALYLAGETALSLGRWPAAADRFERFLEVAHGDPRRPSVWVKWVRARANTDPAGAAGAARRALGAPEVAGDGAVAETIALLGIQAARTGEDAAAEAELWAVLAARARDPGLRRRARYEEGAALVRAGEEIRAREALEGYLREAPAGEHAGAAHLALADLARHGPPAGGDVALALSHLSAALALPEDPEVAVRRVELRQSALSLALSLGDRDAAAGYARDLLADESVLPVEERARVHLTLAAAAASLEEALQHWQAVPEEASRFRESRLVAAQALLEAGRPAEALAILDIVLAAEAPGSEALLTALAAAEDGGDHRRAAELAGKLAALEPVGTAGAGLLQRKARALRALGDDDAYAQALEELAARPPDELGVSWAAAELAGRAFPQGDWDGVLRWGAVARAGAGLSPVSEAALTLQEAEALWRLGRADEAREAFAALAARQGPGRPAALARLGGLLEEAGDPTGAVRAYREALASGLSGGAVEWVRERLSALEEGEGTGVR